MTLATIWKLFMGKPEIKKAESRLKPFDHAFKSKELLCPICHKPGEDHIREKTQGEAPAKGILYNLRWFKPATSELKITCPEEEK